MPLLPRHPPVHPVYSLFFLTLEPITAVAGFVAAYFAPALYLGLTDHSIDVSASQLLTACFDGLVRSSASSSPSPSSSPFAAAAAAAAAAANPVPAATLVSLAQLANLYLLFALNEAVVLRSSAGTASWLGVWRALLACLLVADAGHLWSVRTLGGGVYWRVWEWNAMDFGNVGIVYVGASLRVAFLCGIGVYAEGAGAGGGSKAKEDKKKRR